MAGAMAGAIAGAAMLRGATLVSRGGGNAFGGGPLPLLLVEPLFALCTLAVSSFNRAISEKTWASGWYCGPQSSR